MLNLLRIIALLTTTLAAGCATGPSEESFDSAVGKWKTKWLTISGSPRTVRLTIFDESKATYGYHSGRILFYAVDDQRNWEGYWVESYAQNISCAESKDGSDVWGVVKFQFNDTYTQFTGDWDACGKGAKYPWNGRR